MCLSDVRQGSREKLEQFFDSYVFYGIRQLISMLFSGNININII